LDNQSATAELLAFAQRFKAAYESGSGPEGGGREVPSLAGRSAASFPGTLVCPGLSGYRLHQGDVWKPCTASPSRRKGGEGAKHLL
jgi:hypothetical protein